MLEWKKSIYMVPCKVPCYIYHRDLKKQALVGKFFKFDLGDPVVYFVVVLEQFDGNVFGKFNIGKSCNI